MALIVFDYDGVQVDSLAMEAKYFTAACHQVGISEINGADDMARFSEGNFYEECDKSGIDPALILKAIDIYNQKLGDKGYHIDPFPGAMELVNETAARFPVYIITSNTNKTVADMYERCHVTGIREILGADVETSKVKKINRIKAQYPGEKIYFIGDTSGDILEARAAGVDVTVGVTWGWHKPEVIASASPDYLYDAMEELAAFLHGLATGTLVADNK